MIRDMLRELKNPWLAGALIAMLVLIILMFNVRISVARDASQWEADDPAVRDWRRLGPENR